MHPYIKHLLEDIENGKRTEKDSFSHSKPITFEEEMTETDHYISCSYYEFCYVNE